MNIEEIVDRVLPKIYSNVKDYKMARQWLSKALRSGELVPREKMLTVEEVMGKSDVFFYAIEDENGKLCASYQRDYRTQTFYESESSARRQRFDGEFEKDKYKVKKFKLVEIL